MKMKYSLIITVACLLFVLPSCKNYLDVVPDNVPTIDNAFTLRQEAEKYLFTCYSYLPLDGDIDNNPAFCAGDEFWMTRPYSMTDAPWQIAMGFQSSNNIYMSIWSNMFKGMRDCNIFLDNISKVVDMPESEKTRWRAEVKFLKAYYHWCLFRRYGPIPITDKNLPVSSTSEEVQVPRQPVDSVANYIAALLDEASADLPDEIANRSAELGRITRPIALAIRARVLVTAASPLFNGNTDYTNIKSYDGSLLFNPAYDAGKWEKAAAACKTAIDACLSVGMKLYTFNKLGSNLSDKLVTQMGIRNSVCEQWNPEVIWNNSNSRTYTLQRYAMPRLDPSKLANEMNLGSLAPTLKMAELFYTANGVPINEDKTWDYANRYTLKTATAQESDYLADGYQTAALHFDREPRFYADVAFDGALWYMQNGTFNVQSKAGQWQSRKGLYNYSATGYFAKKLVNWKYVILEGQELSIEAYPWPEMRLADLYLLYAEALNEVSGPAEEAFTYINQVRQRASLPTVQTSWTNYSRQPGKFQTKEGLRQIIQQERLIELAFEGSRFWDLRRWKRSFEELNKQVTGWDVEQEDPVYYYRPKMLYKQIFQTRDYLWPLDVWDLLGNKKLVQNPGW
jgi:hypothetical protein